MRFWIFTISVWNIAYAFISGGPLGSNRGNCAQTARLAFLTTLDEVYAWNDSFKATFLQDYWQKKPVLIRNAFKPDFFGVPAEEVLALSHSDQADCRLFRNKRGKILKTYGPFTRRKIRGLPQTNWTLLVQEVDRHLPEVAEIWDSYSFIPEWRRDDIMVSYARNGGGIGPHVDNYDVFLVQGRGVRRWRIERAFLSSLDEDARLDHSANTRILKNLYSDCSIDVFAGDMLYLPPRVPHDGLCISEECITLSVGFRAPRYRDLVADACSMAIASVPEDDFVTDSNDCMNDQLLGEIPAHTTNRLVKDVQDRVMKILLNERLMSEWLGKHLSSPIRERKQFSGPFFLDNTTHLSSKLSRARSRKVDEASLPIRATSKVYSNVDEVIDAAKRGSVALRRHSDLKILYNNDTVFVNGEVYTVKCLKHEDANRHRFLDNRVLDSSIVVNLGPEELSYYVGQDFKARSGEGVLLPF